MWGRFSGEGLFFPPTREEPRKDPSWIESNYDTEIKAYQFEPEVEVIKNDCPDERTSLRILTGKKHLKKNSNLFEKYGYEHLGDW